MSSGLNTGCALRPGFRRISFWIRFWAASRLIVFSEHFRISDASAFVFQCSQLRVVYHRPSNLYMDSRDSLSSLSILGLEARPGQTFMDSRDSLSSLSILGLEARPGQTFMDSRDSLSSLSIKVSRSLLNPID